ncbi:MAG: DUF5050 domain-containing protein [Oscillospiraceae bacterium]|nr:DUF5050 domain-containing protein [Oscillospiraceae bacterium]
MDKLGKRWISVFMIFVMTTTLFGCGGGYTSGNGNDYSANDVNGETAGATDSTKSIGSSWQETSDSDNARISSRFNLFNNGLAAAAGNWILYNNPNDNGFLYRMNADGSESTLLCAVSNARDIAVSGEMVYFSSYTSYGVGQKICAYNLRTGELRDILNESGTMLQLHSGNLYFMQSGSYVVGGVICKVSTSGVTGKQEIYNQTAVSDFQITNEGSIYFKSGDFLWKMDTNGGNVQKAYEQVLHDYSSWDCVERIGVTADRGNILFFGEYPQQFDWDKYFFGIESRKSSYVYNYYKNRVAYSDGFGVYLVDTSQYAGREIRGIEAGEGEKLLTASDVSRICIVNGWVFCYQVSTSGMASVLNMIRRSELA